MFVTAVAGLFDTATGKLQFCNAGHDAPLLRVRDGTVRTLESQGGPPLCAWDDFIYSAEEVQFDPGDFLVLFTDGVTEAQGPDKVQFSNARIVAYLQECDMHADMETITKGLHGAVQDFMGGADRFDDIAIIALRYQGPANQM